MYALKERQNKSYIQGRKIRPKDKGFMTKIEYINIKSLYSKVQNKAKGAQQSKHIMAANTLYKIGAMVNQSFQLKSNYRCWTQVNFIIDLGILHTQHEVSLLFDLSSSTYPKQRRKENHRGHRIPASACLLQVVDEWRIGFEVYSS